MAQTKNQRRSRQRAQATNRPNGKKQPSERPVDAHEREIDFLTARQIEQLMAGAKASRYPERNQLIILMLFRHGLRVSELTGLRRSDVNLDEARVWVERLKGSLSTEQPIEGDELRLLRRYLRTREDNLPWLIVSNRLGQMTRRNVQYIIEEAGRAAKLPFHVHPHMLRHSTGYHLANTNAGDRVTQDYLGHRNPRHTTRYTRTASSRFEGLW